MTADDVAYSINRVLNPNLKPNPSPVASGFFGNIVGAADVLAGTAKTASGIKVIDPTTIEFDLVNADATFLNVLATPFASVVPKELAGDDATAFSAKPVGTGPYLFKSYTKGQGATFVKNPAYWQAGQPYLDQIDYKTGQDDNAMLLQIEAGTLDMMGDPLPAGPVHRRHDEPRLHGPDLPPHAGRHRLRVHGHPAGEQRPVQQRQGPPGGQLRHRQGGHPADQPRRRRRGQLHLPARPARLRRRPATRIRTTSRRPRR